MSQKCSFVSELLFVEHYKWNFIFQTMAIVVTPDTEGYRRIRTKLQKGEQVYFENQSEEIAIKYTIPGIMAKFKGGIKHCIQYSSKVVINGMIEGKEITEEEFNNY